MPASSPFTGAEVRFFRSMRWISWLRYFQPYPAAAPGDQYQHEQDRPLLTQVTVRSAGSGPWEAAWAVPGAFRPIFGRSGFPAAAASVCRVDLAPEVVQLPFFDRDSFRRVRHNAWRLAALRRRSAGRAGAGRSRRGRCRDWEDSCGEVFTTKTCGLLIRSTPVPPRWLRHVTPERDGSLASVAPMGRSRAGATGGSRPDLSRCNTGCTFAVPPAPTACPNPVQGWFGPMGARSAGLAAQGIAGSPPGSSDRGP